MVIPAERSGTGQWMALRSAPAAAGGARSGGEGRSAQFDAVEADFGIDVGGVVDIIAREAE